ncbi:MAG: hypothetical protein ACP5RJ_08360 [Conexivisphaera sp.]
MKIRFDHLYGGTRIILETDGGMQICAPISQFRMTSNSLNVTFNTYHLNPGTVEFLNRFIDGTYTERDVEALNAASELSFYSRHRTLNMYAENPKRHFPMVMRRLKLSKRAHERINLSNEFISKEYNTKIMDNIALVYRDGYVYAAMILYGLYDLVCGAWSAHWSNRFAISGALMTSHIGKGFHSEPPSKVIEVMEEALRSGKVQGEDAEKLRKMIDDMKSCVIAEKLTE